MSDGSQTTSPAVGHSLPLRTPALLLRHFVPEDAPLVMNLNREETTRRWLPSHTYADLDEAAAAMAWLIAAYASPGDPRRGPYVLGVEHEESGELLGHVGFSPLGDDVEVSYAIAEGARGRGYGTQALACACGWVAAAFAVGRIVAVTALANLSSHRTLERAGFVHSGTSAMRFQGAEQVVSRYTWAARTSRTAGA
jgi:RimJ/RimL family protein N-acetyltransferase